jgi:hypothetical protein
VTTAAKNQISHSTCMPRCSLRTLLILLAIGPPMVAVVIWTVTLRSFPGIPLTLLILSPVVVLRARRVGRNSFAWVTLLWLLGYVTAIVFMYISVETMTRTLSLGFLERYGKAVARGLTPIGAVAGASFAIVGAGKPIQSAIATER